MINGDFDRDDYTVVAELSQGIFTPTLLTLTSENIISFSVKESICQESKLSCGNAISGEINIRFLYNDDEYPIRKWRGKYLRVYAVSCENRIPMGAFYIENISSHEGITDCCGYDRLSTSAFSSTYYSSYEGEISLRQLAREIDPNVDISALSREEIYLFSPPKNMTKREVMSAIAAFYGCNFLYDRASGYTKFISAGKNYYTLANPDLVIDPQNTYSLDTDNSPGEIIKFTVNGDENYSKETDPEFEESIVVCMEWENTLFSYANDTDIEKSLDLLEELFENDRYLGFNAVIDGDPRIEAGDSVAIVTKDGQRLGSVIFSVTTEYNGALTQTLEARVDALNRGERVSSKKDVSENIKKEGSEENEAVKQISEETAEQILGFCLQDDYDTNLLGYLLKSDYSYDLARKKYVKNSGDYLPVYGSITQNRAHIKTSGKTVTFFDDSVTSAARYSSSEVTALQIGGRALYFTSVYGQGAYRSISYFPPVRKNTSSGYSEEIFKVYVPKSLQKELAKISFTTVGGESRARLRLFSSLSDFELSHDVTEGETALLRKEENAIQSGIKLKDGDILYSLDGKMWQSLGSKKGFGNLNIIDGELAYPPEKELTGELTAHLIFSSKGVPVHEYDNGTKVFNFSSLVVEVPSEAATFNIFPESARVFPDSQKAFTTNLEAVFSLSGASSQNTVLTSTEGTSTTLITGADETVGSLLTLSATSKRYGVTKTAAITVTENVSPSTIFDAQATTAWGEPVLNDQYSSASFCTDFITEQTGELYRPRPGWGFGYTAVRFEEPLLSEVRNYGYFKITYSSGSGNYDVRYLGLAFTKGENFDTETALFAQMTYHTGENVTTFKEISAIGLDDSYNYVWAVCWNSEVRIGKIEAVNSLRKH